MIKKFILGILVSISVVGLIGIPMGDPRFFVNALILESMFVLLTLISFWRLRYALIPNIIISLVVIVGNTASPKHIGIMTNFSPPENAAVLIIGGYVLQGLLMGISLFAFKKRKKLFLK